MKICFFADASENTASYVRPFIDRGHDVQVVSFHPPIPELNVPWVRQLSVRGKWEYLLQLRRARAIVREFRPDLVVGYRLTSYGLLAVHAGFRPVALTATGFDVLWDSGPTRWLRRAVVRHVLRRADLCVCWEEHLAAALPRNGIPIEVFTMPRGVSLDQFHPGALAPEQRPKTIISTRTLKRWYRVDLLLHAFARVTAQVPDARLVIVGDGPERPSLEALAGKLGLDAKVSFPGRLPTEEIAKRLRECSVYVTQIAFDGVSASLLEAMASGVFPVVPDIDANRRWIEDRVGGILYPPGDESRLASALVEALNDAPLRSRAAGHNLRVVRGRGDRSRNADRIEERFVALARGHGRT